MLKRLRIKFICINMGIVVAMLAIILALVIGFTQRNLEQESLAQMQSALNGGGRRDPFSLRNRLDGMPDPEEPRGPLDVFLPYIRVELTEDGGIGSYDGFMSDPDGLSELVAAAMAQSADSGELRDWGLRYLRAETPMGTRLVFADTSNETATLQGLIRTSLLIGCAGIVVFFLISLLLARWAIKPVEEAWQQQKQFVSDASHELKTPLTVIMTNAELLQSADYDAAAKARFSGNILTMARQMRGLVESLLELARIDNGAVETNAAEVNFSKLCADAVLPFEPLCFEKGLSLENGIAPGVRVRGSESHLRQVVEIFLDNAQKYATPGSEIRVTLTAAGRSCRLCVANQGEPISPEDLKRLFDRFFRADASRNRDGSYGLGLSIAQKIVQTHHGKIWAESADGINRFYAAFPLLGTADTAQA